MLVSTFILILITFSFKIISPNLQQEKIISDFLNNLDLNTSSDIKYLARYMSEDCSIDFMFLDKPQNMKGLEQIGKKISLYWRKTPDAKDKIIEVFSK